MTAQDLSPTASADAEAFFVPISEEDRDGIVYRTVEATKHTESPWGPGFQHGSPPAALIAYLLEAGAKDNGYPIAGEGRFGRMSVNILGAVPLGKLIGHTRLLRPGKRIALFEAVVTDEQGREVIRGRGWWLKTTETTEIRREVGPVVDGPHGAEQDTAFLERWKSGYIDAIDVRQVASPQPEYDAHDRGNPIVAWARSDYPVMLGEADSPWTGLMKTVDIANGVNEVLDPAQWGFMNVDLGVYLHRLPTSDWTDLWSEHNYGVDGIGTTIARIYDEDGPIGAINQAIMLAPQN